MSRFFTRYTLLALLLLGVLAACDTLNGIDPLRIEQLEGTWDLQSVSGQAPPIQWSVTADDWKRELAAGRLVVREAPRYEMQWNTYAIEQGGAQRRSLYPFFDRGQVILTGGKMFRLEEWSNGMVGPWPFEPLQYLAGELHGDVLTIQADWNGEKKVFRYRRTAR